MMASFRILTGFVAFALGILASPVVFASASSGMTDDQVYQKLIDRSSAQCIHYTADTAEAAIRGVPIAAARSANDHNFLFCPDPTLGDGKDILWFGARMAIVWNPTVRPSADTMAKEIANMAQKDEYSPGVLVWSSFGDEVKGALIPPYQTRCASANAADCN